MRALLAAAAIAAGALLVVPDLPVSQPPQPTSEPAAPASPTASPTADRIVQLTKSGDTLADEAGAAILTLLKLVGLAASVYVGVGLVARALALLRSREVLAIEELTNASGDTAFSPLLPGISQLLRERLGEEMHAIGLRAGELPPAKAAEFQSNTLADPLATLLSSISEVIPAPLKQVATVLAVLYPRTGIRVTGSALKFGEDAGDLAVTMTVSSIQGAEPPTMATFWETKKGKTALGLRYVEVVRVAARWLAIELLKRQLLATWRRNVRSWLPGWQAYLRLCRVSWLGARWSADLDVVRSAWVHRYIGALIGDDAAEPERGPAFYELAARDLRRATLLTPVYPLAHHTLGNYLSFWGIKVQEQDQSKAAELQRQSIEQYDMALEELENDDPRALDSAEEAILKDRTRTREILVDRVRSARATSLLLLGGSAAVEEATTAIKKFGKTPSKKLAGQTAYNVASWYTTAMKMGVTMTPPAPTPLTVAGRFLLHAMLQDVEYASYVERDPDFGKIQEKIAALKRQRAEVASDPALTGLSAEAYATKLDEALNKAGWVASGETT